MKMWFKIENDKRVFRTEINSYSEVTKLRDEFVKEVDEYGERFLDFFKEFIKLDRDIGDIKKCGVYDTVLTVNLNGHELNNMLRIKKTNDNSISHFAFGFSFTESHIEHIPKAYMHPAYKHETKYVIQDIANGKGFDKKYHMTIFFPDYWYGEDNEETYVTFMIFKDEEGVIH